MSGPLAGRHGAWHLPNHQQEDKRIREMLGRGDSIGDVAAAIGVAEGYVRAIATEGDGDDAPPHKPDVNLPAVESPVALTRVACIVAGEEIGARDCIARQVEHKCFCPRAAFAINAVAAHVLPGTRLEDQLVQCRAFARSVMLQAERYHGPARHARDGKKVTLPLVSPVALPAPPKHDEPKRPTLAETWREAQAEKIAAAATRASSGAGGVKAERAPPGAAANASPAPAISKPKQQQPAMPAEESQVECKLDGETLRADNKRGCCSRHFGSNGRFTAAAMAEAEKRGFDVPEAFRPRVRGEEKPAAAARPQTNGHAKPARAKAVRQPKPPPSAPAIPEDIVGLLQRQRDHYQAQLARIDKALAALRD